MTRETYTRSTATPASFAQVHRGDRRLVERKLPLVLKTMGPTWNQHEAPWPLAASARARASPSASTAS